ncbi:MAG: translation initiation factor eIF-2B [Dehalococcoidales bacterium]|nr:translation initiation factor eIF-2B [Dehalococcoidales bacterium]
MDIREEIETQIEGIKSNTTDGASELARQAILVMKAAAETSEADNARDFLLEQKEVGKRLIAARRTMAPIPNIITRYLREIIRDDRKDDLIATKQQAVRLAEDMHRDSVNAVSKIISSTAELIDNKDVILTHSYSSTVVAAIKEIAELRRGIKVIVTKSGTGCYGERTARELAEAGIPIMYIDDTAVGLYISGVSKVLVGADRITADGKVINGAGTCTVAATAKMNTVPVYVLCETLKFDFAVSSSKVNLEERGNTGLIEEGILSPEIKISNPTFDITPLDFVTAIVSENGVVTADKMVTS